MDGSGLAHEYEIKLTAADFRADVQKARQGKSVVDKQIVLTVVTKHELLAAHDQRGPSRFWYVMPRDMIDLADVPAWAGVRWVQPRPRGFAFTMARSAPLLHSERVDPAEIEKARTACYYRYWRERLRADAQALKLRPQEILK